VAWVLGLPVDTIGSRFGGIPQAMPAFTPLVIDWPHLDHLLPPAFKIALLGAIESLLCAVVADKATGERHDSDQERMAQGIANIASPLFGGMAATSAIARTATNIHNGGKTPVSGMTHALTVLLIVLVAAPLAAYVPLAGLAAILVSVSIKMGDWDIRKAWHYPKRDTTVLVLTFALTVLFDLTIAIEIGLLLAAILFIHRIADQTELNYLTADFGQLFARHTVYNKVIPPATQIYRIEGPLFFGTVDKLQAIERGADSTVRVVILQLHRATMIDTTGLLELEDLANKLASRGQSLILCGPTPRHRKMLDDAGLTQLLGADRVLPDLVAALACATLLVEVA
jgi:SulP family sulfate permease